MSRLFSLLRLKQFALLGLSVALTLVVVEIILRVAAPIYPANDPRAYIYDAELGFRLRPGYDSRRTTDFQQESHTNQLGTVNYQKDFAAYPKLVFTVGDSYTQGTGLPADANYPFQLDLRLNTDERGFYAPRYGVVNLGQAAYGGEQELIWLRRLAQQLRPPDVILYLGCDNDYDDDRLFLSGYMHRHLVEGNPYWGRWARPLQWLTNDLQLGLRAKLALSRWRQRRVTDSGATAGGPSVAQREASVMERLADYAREHKSLLIVGWSNDSASYDWLQGWAAQHQVPFADWRARVRAVRGVVPDAPTHNPHSGGHHRTWVNYLIAEEFARQLTQTAKP